MPRPGKYTSMSLSPEAIDAIRRTTNWSMGHTSQRVSHSVTVLALIETLESQPVFREAYLRTLTARLTT